jgi:hypothetical protein
MPEPAPATEMVTWSDLPRTRRQRLAVLVGQLAWRMTQGRNPMEAGYEPLETNQRDAAEQSRGPSS